MLKEALLVAGGGAAGSLLRWGVGLVLQRGPTSGFPWGTLTVNLAGSLAIGVLGALALERAHLPPAARTFLLVGVLGGFTTFSTFSFETFALLRDGQWMHAGLYGAGSVLGGLAATVAGYALVARL